MLNLTRAALALPLLALASACVSPPSAPAEQRPTVSRPSTPPPQRPTGNQPSQTRPNAPEGFAVPRVMNDRGLEFVIGARASQLEQTFGPARLDVIEGDARKLQFVGEACVLDVYLYPLAPGAEPTATYVDARRASDALDVDRAACAEALKR